MNRSLALSFVFVFVSVLDVSPTAATNLQYEVDGMMPYLAFDRLPKSIVDVPGGRLSVAFAPGSFKLDKTRLLAWVGRAAGSVATYYGRFPVRSARVLIVPIDGSETSGGQAFGNAGAAVRLMAGRDVSEDALARDWQLTHEMVHLSFPNIPRKTWLSEGLAVYVEPIARVQAGDLTARYVWGDFAEMLPMGLPKKGDKGLDAADGRDRIYYGGALYWLIADIEIRKRTDNRLGVQDALRAVLREGGTIEEVWPVERTLSVADAATGQKVLTEMHTRWKSRPVSPDLDTLWRDLGIKAEGKTVSFDDNAPLAAIRQAITARRSPD